MADPISYESLVRVQQTALDTLELCQEFRQDCERLIVHARRGELRGVVPVRGIRFENEPKTIDLDREYEKLSSWWRQLPRDPASELIDLIVACIPDRSTPIDLSTDDFSLVKAAATEVVFDLASLLGGIGRQVWIRRDETILLGVTSTPAFYDAELFGGLGLPSFHLEELCERVKLECSLARKGISEGVSLDPPDGPTSPRRWRFGGVDYPVEGLGMQDKPWRCAAALHNASNQTLTAEELAEPVNLDRNAIPSDSDIDNWAKGARRWFRVQAIPVTIRKSGNALTLSLVNPSEKFANSLRVP